MSSEAAGEFVGGGQLKLVDLEKDRGDVLPFERRTADRRRVSGRVTAIRTTPANPDARTRICSLELKNLSHTGVAAICQEPIEHDMELTIFFPPHGHERGFDLRGSIVRCEASEYGYLLGIQLEEGQNLRSRAS